jgi:hypothetical protein
MKMHQICHTRVNHCTFQHLRNLVPELWEEEPKYRAKTPNPVQEAPFHGRTGRDPGWRSAVRGYLSAFGPLDATRNV